MRVLHRDVKSRNVLMSGVPDCANLSHSLLPTMKLGDMGLSRFLPNTSTEKLSAWVGTVRYMAPEVLFNDDYGFPADVFSCAVLVQEIFSGKKPYSEHNMADHTLIIHIVKGLRPQVDELYAPAQVSDKLRTLLAAAWCNGPEDRIYIGDFTSSLADMHLEVLEFGRQLSS